MPSESLENASYMVDRMSPTTETIVSTLITRRTGPSGWSPSSTPSDLRRAWARIPIKCVNSGLVLIPLLISAMQIPIVSPLADDPKAETTVKIIAGKVFDPYTLQLLDKRVITVSPVSGLITDIHPWSDSNDIQVCDDADTTVIDLRSLTVLAGFVDVHVHCTWHQYYHVFKRGIELRAQSFSIHIPKRRGMTR